MTLSQLKSEETSLEKARLRIAERWSHKAEGTAQTHEHASRRGDPLTRLFISGHIDRDQLTWAEEINEVFEGIERDVAVRVVGYEPRVDRSRSGAMGTVLSHLETVRRVRMEVAYSWWRSRLPRPCSAVLEMLVGDQLSFSTVALRHGMHKRRARRLLIDALDLWPEALKRAELVVDEASLTAAQSGLC